MKLLVDTSAMLALYLRDDRNHEAAVGFVRAKPRTRFVLTELILSETATRLAARAGAARAAEATEQLLESQRYELVLLDVPLLRGALEQMKRHPDKRLSFTDCASFEVMQRLGIGAAFTFDRDFRDCGFEMLP